MMSFLFRESNCRDRFCARQLPALVGFVHRVAYAVLFAFIIYFGARLPLYDNGQVISFGAGALVFFAHILDVPIALVSLLDMPYLAGLDLFFGHGVGEFMTSTEVLTWHVRLSILVYVPLFYLPQLVRALVRRMRQRSSQLPPPVNERGGQAP
jgi:hypothetical protein